MKEQVLLKGKEPPDKVEILEDGNRFLVDIKLGQKTGFYLDQKENRKRLKEFSHGQRGSQLLQLYRRVFSLCHARRCKIRFIH